MPDQEQTDTIENTENISVQTENEENTHQRKFRTRDSFELDDRITVRLDFNLAMELSEVLTTTANINPALFALGRKLSKLEV